MMTRWSCAVAVVCLMACSEQPPMAGACGGETCSEAQRCDPSSLHCVTNAVPKLTLVAPATVISDATFVISGTVVDDTGGTRLAWRDGVGEWQPIEASSDGKFSFSVPARELDAEPMYLSVRADDATTQVEASTLVIVDRVGPKFELTAPLSVVGGAQATVTIVARDGSEGLQDLSIAGQDLSSPRTGTELSAQVTIPSMDRKAIPVAVVAKDLNGNRTTQTFMVQVDGAGPSLRFVSPTAQTPVTNGAAYRVEVEAIDLSGVQQLRVAMDDGGFVAAVAQDGGVWAAELPIPLAEQTVRFTAEAVDVVGNVSTLGSAPLDVDRLAPTVQVMGPDPDSAPRGVLYVRAESADAVSANATFGGRTVALSKEFGSWQGQIPVTLTGDHVPEFLVVVVRDAAGNQGTSAPYRLFIDTVAPTLTFTAPAANAKLNRSSFVTTDEVVVAWQVLDGDPRAHTISVDGEPTTATEARLPTWPTDDGRSITTTVAVSDGYNTTTGTLTFSVDRVAPTILSWSPAANARNVEPRTASVSFSERVTGPTTSTDALTISPGVTQPGTWDAAHSTWTSAGLTPYSVFTASLGNLADDSGNPVDVVAPRRFHTAATGPASGAVLATGVTGFNVVSDSDGVVTVAVTTPAGYRVFGLNPVTGAVESPSITDVNGGQFSLNASMTVDPATLVATHRVGSARYGGVGTGPFVPIGLVRHGITNGVAGPLGSTADAAGVVISQGAFSGEGDSSAFALTNGTSYQRGALNRLLPTTPHLVVAQSNSTWAAFSTSAAGLAWSRFLCIPNSYTGVSTCNAFSFSAASVDPTEVRAAIAPGGRCLVATWKTNTGRAALFQQLMGCDEQRPVGVPPHPSCQNNQVVAAVPVTNRLRVAPFGGNGENTLLGAWDTGNGGVQLAKLSSPAACTNAFTPVGVVNQLATAFEPVQLGNKPALLYTDASRNLILYAP